MLRELVLWVRTSPVAPAPSVVSMPWIDRQLRAATSPTSACSRRWPRCRASEFVPAEYRARRDDDTPAPDRLRPDHLPAVHRRLDDAGAGRRSRARACSRSAPGRGYQTAILARAGRRRVQPRDRFPSSPSSARATLARLGYARACICASGSGYDGWPDAAPFDRIILTAAPPAVPAGAHRPARRRRTPRSRRSDRLRRSDEAEYAHAIGRSGRRKSSGRDERDRQSRSRSRFVPMELVLEPTCDPLPQSRATSL